VDAGMNGRKTEFFVAQICNLLYRRIAFGRAWKSWGALQDRGGRRMPFCDPADCQSALRAEELSSAPGMTSP
jgi:hypothetical protein